MGKKTQSFDQRKQDPLKWWEPILLIPFILLTIGDTILWIIHIGIIVLKKTYNISSAAISHFFSLGTIVAIHARRLKQRIRFFLQSQSEKKLYDRKTDTTPIPVPTKSNKPFNDLQSRIRRFLIFISHIHLPNLHTDVFHARSTLKIPTLSHPGQAFKLPTKDLSIHREKPRKRAGKFQGFQWFVIGSIVTFLLLFIPYTTYVWLKALPHPQLLSQRNIEVTTKILDRNGNILYEIYSDQNRTPLALSSIPDVVKKATISIEDREFYYHLGFSLRGMVRATKEIAVNKQVQGGSTITQQLIKSALLTPEVKLSRKVKEVVLAFWAERIFTKDQILEMYLNQVPYGGTSWGVEAASQTYFGKSVRDLDLAQAALLAGLPAAPSDYSPFGPHPQKALERQKEVLRRMAEDGYITDKQAQEAASEELTFVTPHTNIRAPHFVMYVKKLLEDKYGARVVEQGGLRVVTSLDISLQDKVQNIVSQHIASLKSLNVGNGAAVVTNPKTGEILAMVGSKDYFDTTGDGNVNIATSLRQPGSSIKVVTYATALENGFTAASLLDDSPVVYTYPGSPSYAPVNYDGKFHGIVPLRYALGNSFNIPAVKTLAKIGLPAMIDKGKKMGIKSWDDDSRFGLSLTLGGGEVTMLDMAEVFGTLANSGKQLELEPILEVTDYTGHVLERFTPKTGIQVVRQDVDWILGNILSDNTARILEFGASSSLVIPGKTVPVKTGTSNDKRDNWTNGYTPSYVTVVWVGNNDNSPMNQYLASGITGAAPIWHDIMTELLKDKPDEVMERPNNVVSIPCYNGRPEFFVKGTEPTGGQCAPLPTPSPSPLPTP
jgi:penicillin-binding protein 1C